MPILGAAPSFRRFNVFDFGSRFKFLGESVCGLASFMNPSVAAEFSPAIALIPTETTCFVILSSMYSPFSLAILPCRYMRRDGQHFTSMAALSLVLSLKPVGIQEPQPNSGRTNSAFQLRGRPRSISAPMPSKISSTDGAATSESKSKRAGGLNFGRDRRRSVRHESEHESRVHGCLPTRSGPTGSCGRFDGVLW